MCSSELMGRSDLRRIRVLLQSVLSKDLFHHVDHRLCQRQFVNGIHASVGVGEKPPAFEVHTGVEARYVDRYTVFDTDTPFSKSLLPR